MYPASTSRKASPKPRPARLTRRTQRSKTRQMRRVISLCHLRDLTASLHQPRRHALIAEPALAEAFYLEPARAQHGQRPPAPQAGAFAPTSGGRCPCCFSDSGLAKPCDQPPRGAPRGAFRPPHPPRIFGPRRKSDAGRGGTVAPDMEAARGSVVCRGGRGARHAKARRGAMADPGFRSRAGCAFSRPGQRVRRVRQVPGLVPVLVPQAIRW